MQNTSATWQKLWAAGAALEARAIIGGVEYAAITAPVITRALMQGGPSVGNAVSASCAFSLRTEDAIPKSAEVKLIMRLADGETASEWLPAGTFYISRRTKDAVTGLISLECYDALLRANAQWEDDGGAWPRPMAEVVADIAARIGVETDGRTAIRSEAGYVVNAPEAGTALRDLLGFIAAAHGGNWIVTPAGKLRLVPFCDADADAVDVAAILTAIDAGAAGRISGVRCATEEATFLVGDETGYVVDAAAPAFAAEVGEAIIGTAWQPCALRGAVYDPAAELGDALRAGSGGEVVSVLCSETATLGATFRGDIAAPGGDEAADEYPYIGGTAKTLALAKAYARESVEALDATLDQRAIFDRLTGGGTVQGLIMADGQLYVNASYISTGELSANLINGGTLTLGGENNKNGSLRVLDNKGKEIGLWTGSGLKIYGEGGLQVGETSSSDTFATLENGSFQITTEYPDEGVKRPVFSLEARYEADKNSRVCTIHSGKAPDENDRLDIWSDNVRILGQGSQINTNVTIRGSLSVSGALSAGNGASGSFTTANGRTVQVVNGIVTRIY